LYENTANISKHMQPATFATELKTVFRNFCQAWSFCSSQRISRRSLANSKGILVVYIKSPNHCRQKKKSQKNPAPVF